MIINQTKTAMGNELNLINDLIRSLDNIPPEHLDYITSRRLTGELLRLKAIVYQEWEGRD